MVPRTVAPVLAAAICLGLAAAAVNAALHGDWPEAIAWFLALGLSTRRADERA
jgi:hypothetical protein